MTPLTSILGFAILVAMTWRAEGGTITTFSDRSSFDSAVSPSPLTVEDFTNWFHYPITTGVLNSSTNLATFYGTPISPGDIQPGVTYSTTTGTGNFFNIAFEHGFSDGLLDSEIDSSDPRHVLHVAFDDPTRAFGLDTNLLSGKQLSLVIHFTSGSDFVGTYDVPDSFSLQFFGFESALADITGVDIQGNSTRLWFAVDNFTFTTAPVAAIPEPASLLIFAGLAVIGCAGWRRGLRGSSRAWPSARRMPLPARP